jgi:glycerol-3-phosphate dehydrogenase
MAKDAIDLAASRLESDVQPSRTDRLPLIGAEGFPDCRARCVELASEVGLGVQRVERLLDRYGSLTLELLAQIADRPDLGENLDGADGYLRVEALYAATHEGALHLDDLLTRRTRISIETDDRGLRAAEAVCELVAEALEWSPEDCERELSHYRARVAAERDSQEQRDDRTADAARLGAPDVRTGRRG